MLYILILKGDYHSSSVLKAKHFMFIFNIFVQIFTFFLLLKFKSFVHNSHIPLASSARFFAKTSNDLSQNLDFKHDL